MSRFKRFLVRSLEKACDLLDEVPRFDVHDRQWYRGGCWGCQMGLARMSAALDKRWNTGVWKHREVTDEDQYR